MRALGSIAVLSALAWNMLLAGLCQAAQGSHVITGDVVCDNEFAIFTANGEGLGMAVSFTGVTGCWPGAVSVAVNTTDRFLYIACWSDIGVAQGLLHDLQVDGNPAFSDDPRWSVTYTDSDHPICLGAPPAAMYTTMEATIPAPPGGWNLPAIGCANPASGGPSCYGAWGHVASIDVGVGWSWYDSGNQSGPDAPFFPGFDHREFLIFRFDMGGGGPGTNVCFGDGTGIPCPCGNENGQGNGCANSTGAGAHLTVSGTASMNYDLTFTMTGAPNQPSLLFQGVNTINGGLGVPFGDGIRCCGGTITRLGIRHGNGSTSITFGATDLGVTPGDKRCFQKWYRDPPGPCTSGFNLTNAITITFQP